MKARIQAGAQIDAVFLAAPELVGSQFHKLSSSSGSVPRPRHGCNPSPGRSSAHLSAHCVAYDLRHAAASLWLNSGAPTEVARRLGHSVVMLLKVYAGRIRRRTRGSHRPWTAWSLQQ